MGSTYRQKCMEDSPWTPLTSHSQQFEANEILCRSAPRSQIFRRAAPGSKN